MDQSTNRLNLLQDAQIPVAFNRLQDAVTEHVEDMNKRFNAGLTIRQTQTTFEAHELERAEALVTASLPYEHHHPDQEASSRMDSEGCPNCDNEEDDTLAEELSQDADTPHRRLQNLND